MKFLRRGGSELDETEATGRFLREAKAVVRLRDEHVVKVFDVGTLETGEPYMVMEYLDGCDLDRALQARGPLPMSRPSSTSCRPARRSPRRTASASCTATSSPRTSSSRGHAGTPS